MERFGWELLPIVWEASWPPADFAAAAASLSKSERLVPVPNVAVDPKDRNEPMALLIVEPGRRRGAEPPNDV